MNPHTTTKAKQIWESLDPETRDRIVRSAWCGNCKQNRRIVDFKTHYKAGLLVLRGYCTQCGSHVARAVEDL